MQKPILAQSWYRKRHWLSSVLTPLSWLFRGVSALRRLAYRTGFATTHHFPVPIIVVGNITVGGTGKTPLVIALAELLRYRGFHPGIVSRGYGAISPPSSPLLVKPEMSAHDVGDEALLIAEKTHCPTSIFPQRAKAVAHLLAHHACDVILSDDGLQHYALARDIEIAVVDGERRFGNQKLLPAGPLRESVKRLKQVDFIVTNGEPSIGEFGMQLQINSLHQVLDPTIQIDVAEIKAPRIHAVAAIGNPVRFFDQLKKTGLDIIEHPFPDHYLFTPKDFHFLKEADIVIMTEKDAVKCRKMASRYFWYLPVQAVLEPSFIEQLLARLLDKKVSKSNEKGVSSI